MAVKVNYIALPESVAESEVSIMDLFDNEIIEHGFCKLASDSCALPFYYDSESRAVWGDFTDEGLGSVILLGSVHTYRNGRHLNNLLGQVSNQLILNNSYDRFYRAEIPTPNELERVKNHPDCRLGRKFILSTEGVASANDSETAYAFPILRLPLRYRSYTTQDLLENLLEDYGLHPNIIPPEIGIEDSKLEEYLLGEDSRRFDAPRLPREILGPTVGAWSLFKYVGLTNYGDSQKGVFDVSGKDIYAVDPREKVSTGFVALDFGTTSTVAAVSDGITIKYIAIGKGQDKERYENPTILMFLHRKAFWDAYRSGDCYPPATEHKDILVAGSAKESMRNNEGVGWDSLRFFDHLKMWAADQRRKVFIRDRDDDWEIPNYSGIKADYLSASPDKSLDPIEIYAYYVGLAINSMSNGRIYTEYLISHSTAIDDQTYARIADSFKRGLTKSIPFKTTPGEIKLEISLDEGTAYSFAALERHFISMRNSNNGSCGTDDGQKWLDDLTAGKFYCGVFDMGGGTLDFSFIQYKRREDRLFECTILNSAGEKNLGCEPLLESVSYDLAYAARGFLNRLNVKVARPPHTTEQNESFMVDGTSINALENLRRIVRKLNECWIDKSKTMNIQVLSEFNEPVRINIVSEDNETSIFVEAVENNSSQNDGDAVIEDAPNSNANYVFSGIRNTVSVDSVNVPGAASKIDKSVEKMFEDHIDNGIRLFIRLWASTKTQYDIPTENTVLRIFLGGNASRAKRVEKLIEYRLEEEERQFGSFKVYPCLPTVADEKEINDKGAFLPGAKTGVVYGMLRARSGLIVTQPMGGAKFRYNIGRTIFDIGGDIYHPLSSKREAVDEYRLLAQFLKPINKSIPAMLVYYSSDDSFGLSDGDFPLPDNAAGLDSINLMSNCPFTDDLLSQYIYFKYTPGYVDKIDIGAADNESGMNIQDIAHCDLNTKTVVWGNTPNFNQHAIRNATSLPPLPPKTPEPPANGEKKGDTGRLTRI